MLEGITAAGGAWLWPGPRWECSVQSWGMEGTERPQQRGVTAVLHSQEGWCKEMEFGVSPFLCGIWELPGVATFVFPRVVQGVCRWFLCLLHKKSDNCRINQKYRLLSSFSLPNGNPEDAA